jgi:hypothetical protein
MLPCETVQRSPPRRFTHPPTFNPTHPQFPTIVLRALPRPIPRSLSNRSTPKTVTVPKTIIIYLQPTADFMKSTIYQDTAGFGGAVTVLGTGLHW